MAARFGGIVLLVIGAVSAGIGLAMAMTLLGQPVPGGEAVDALRPFLDKIAAEAALPAGSDAGALVNRGWGQIAIAAMAAGGVIALGGLRQMLTGQRSLLLLMMIGGIILGFAVAAVMA
jgi:hypothetical protein